MPAILVYLFKLSAGLALVYLFYRGFLRRLTFYNWNRFYLLACSLLCFIIPFVNITPLLERNEIVNYQMIRLIPAVGNPGPATGSVPVNQGSLSLFSWEGLLWIFAGGMLILFIRLSIQLLSFRRILKKARLISGEGVKLYQVDRPIIPFSFGNSIFINQRLHPEDEMGKIIRHEFIHVTQKHTVDIAWAEWLCLFNWFNPFVWLIRKAIRQNLEFIADQKVLESGIGKKEYQYLLLRVTGNNHFSIASQFNYSSLQKRIAMMNKMKSAKTHTLKFLIALPVMALLLLAFRAGQQTRPLSGFPLPMQPRDTIPVVKSGNDKKDTIPEVAGEGGLFREPARAGDDIEITDQKAIVKQKNGITREYNLKRPSEKREFEKKYGKIISIARPAVKGEGASTVIEIGTGETYVVDPATATTVISAAPARATRMGTTVSGPTAIESTPVADAGSTTIYPVLAEDDITAGDKILFTINRNSTAEDLDNFKKLMKEKSLDLTFGKMEFSPRGYLKNISGSIGSNDVKGKFSASDFDKVIVAIVQENGKTYFRINIVVKSKAVI